MTRRPLLEDDADYVIVGTGAGGATAARVLSEAGLCGGACSKRARALRARAAPRAAARRDDASRCATSARSSTSGSAPIPLLQGRCVGGSTAINSGIIWRMPDDVRQRLAASASAWASWSKSARQRRIFEQLEARAARRRGRRGGARRQRATDAARQRSARACPAEPMRRNAKRLRGQRALPAGLPERRAPEHGRLVRAARARATARGCTRCARATRVVIEGGRACGGRGRACSTPTCEPRGRFRVARAARRDRRGGRDLHAAAAAAQRPARRRRRSLPGAPRRRGGRTLSRAGRDGLRRDPGVRGAAARAGLQARVALAAARAAGDARPRRGRRVAAQARASSTTSRSGPRSRGCARSDACASGLFGGAERALRAAAQRTSNASSTASR